MSTHATNREALLRAFELRWEVEEAADGASDELDDLIAEAEGRGWADVVRVGLYVAIARARADVARTGRDRVAAAVEALRERAEADGEPTMLAVALSFRVSAWLAGTDASVLMTADRELARATVLLEADSGSALERVVGHNRCASAHAQRGLWELANEQYDYAEKLLLECEETRYGAAVRFNRAELLLDWASALREIEETPALGDLCSLGLAAVASASRDPSMPETWRLELAVMGALFVALTGGEQGDLPKELLAGSGVGSEYEGHLHLATALAYPAVELEEAAREAELAVTKLDPALHQPEYELALRVAAELESARSDTDDATAGMRYGQRQVEQRWGTRLSTLAAVQSLIESERLVVEHDLLRREVFLDELTGLSNRRGFQAYLSGIAVQDVGCIAMLLLDVDHFKQVNDRFGHGAGDETLIRLGRVLAGSVRPSDNAARLGGDEFAVVIAGADLSTAHSRSNLLLEELAAEVWADVHPDLEVKVSIGVAAGPPSRIEELSARADGALYEAKAEGGDRSVAR